MKFVDEFRDAATVNTLAEALHKTVTQAWKIMEICGGQTHAILKYGINQLLPTSLTLVHGPGCPVCVTAVEKLDLAIEIAQRPEVIFCTFGDMLRVPGTEKDLQMVKAAGGDIRAVYSPLDAIKIAQQFADKQVVFFAIGFETTAPTTAMAAYQAKKLGLKNFSMLVSHVLVPPAMEVILSSAENQVQGFLAAGHVCTVMGYQQYKPIAKRYQVPIVVTGFEPVDIMQGILHCVQQLENGTIDVENQFNRAVTEQGNVHAQAMIQRVFKTVVQQWRGLGEITDSGLALNDQYAEFDAEQRFAIATSHVAATSLCKSGEVLRGVIKPNQCPAFAKQCTPEHPLGATMVSSEGACAAYYRYRPALNKPVSSAL